ncbi:hypothetical protein OEZ85_009604 [Tetradesmus obliquus]|uniref:Bifunctional inhibitor/plant lipid transfer protein/seed storage helical domain-containing protein n=1 Tax=Tetradesmus obliquus TaxID=3088 RepID=A0ABY8UCC6_TETOB|nr:hypothetical protein OEZ85_009604 [Tetradesmus obliquus]
MASVKYICFSLLVAAQIASAAVAPAAYDKTLIVADLAKCPVKSVAFDPKDFDPTAVVGLSTTLETPDVTEKCRTAAFEQLINCYTDSDKMSSLAIMTGCCSKACATALEESVKSGCFAQYTTAICKDPASASVQLGLSHTAKRCANYVAACPANATKASNTTTTAAAKGANATAVAAKSADLPAESPAPATSPEPKKNSAVSMAAASCVSVVMAAAALVLAVL